MPSKVVVGAQWGDEGKGKVIDILAQTADVVVRAQGGNNAGHTVEHDGQTYKLQLIPSGILYKNNLCLVGGGVVVDPKVILGEIEKLQARGVPCENLRIDPRAHVIMPWHIAIDSLSEDSRPQDKRIGTTRRGIGPCYMDKSERSGLRIFDLVNEQIFREKAARAGGEKNNLITKYYGGQALNIEEIIDEYAGYGQRLKKYVADVSVLTYEAHKAGKKILFEGAQGTLLDLDMGTYPYVTSSHPVAGGFTVGVGVGPSVINDVIGVAKAYTTRVGEGPFPTELKDELGDKIRTKGGEFGTVTGRPRRVGWFDTVILRYAVRVNGLTELTVNKLDTLSGMGELKICTGYELDDGTQVRDWPSSLEELALCKPVYITLPGFEEDITACTEYAQLPQACKNYIEKLEQLCDCPVTMIGVGPDREQNVYKKAK